MFLAEGGSWSDQWRWTKAQWAAAGPGLTTIRRIAKSALFRLFRPLLPAFVHADNPFVRSFNSAVHCAGPISVQVPDPGLTDFGHRRLGLTFWFIAAELGGKDKIRRAGWEELARRANEAHADNARVLAANSPPKRAAALRDIERRATGNITDLSARDPALMPGDSTMAGQTPAERAG